MTRRSTHAYDTELARRAKAQAKRQESAKRRQLRREAAKARSAQQEPARP